MENRERRAIDALIQRFYDDAAIIRARQSVKWFPSERPSAIEYCAGLLNRLLEDLTDDGA